MFSNIGLDLSDEEGKNINHKDKNGNRFYNKIKGSKTGADDSKNTAPNVIEAAKVAKKSTKEQDQSKVLHKATREGLISIVKAVIIDNGTLINSLDENGFCPLHIAARYNRVQIVDALLNYGAICDLYSTPGGLTPLHVAARFNSLESARSLLDQGASPNAQSSTGATPLHIASRFNNPDFVKLLISQSNTELEYRESNMFTPLHFACAYGHHDIVQILMAHGTDIEACALENLTVLHTAVTGGNGQVVSAVIDAAIQRYLKSPVSIFEPQKNDSEFIRFISAKDDSGNTPLHTAIKSGNLEAAKLLISYNVDPNGRTNLNQTPLHIAAICGEWETVAMLLSAHAEVNCQDEEMKTPLHYAASFGNDNVIKHLWDHGAQVNIKDVNKMTPFLCAVTAGRLECARILLEYGADICALDAHGRCCLHLAVENEQEQIVALLAQSKAGISLVDHSEPGKERTPVHYAAITANLKILELLLQCKPNCTLKDVNRKTALHLAAESGKARFVETLVRSGLTALFDRDDTLRTPLHYAAMNKRRKACITLLQFGAEIDCQDINRWTPIMWAARSGDQATTALFLEREIQIDRTDNEGNTVLHVACNNGHVDVAKLLLDNGAEISLNNNKMSGLDCAIEQQNSDVVMAIVKHNRWEDMLRIKSSGTQNTMSSLIQYYPEAAEVVMDRCVQRSHSSMTYNFRYLDPGPDDCSGPNKGRYIGLADMVNYKRQELLIHPLAKKLLNIKWNKFGRAIFIFNLLLYMFFLMMLSMFISRQRQKLLVPAGGFDNSTYALDSLDNETNLGWVTPLVLMGFASFHMLKEVYQMLNLGVRYFKDPINLLEWCLYATTFLFMLPFITRNEILPIEPKIMWQVGSCSVFLGFANLILFLRVLSQVGLYVTMYLEVVKTLMKCMSLFVIFILGFSLVFYILFKEEQLSKIFTSPS